MSSRAEVKPDLLLVAISRMMKYVTLIFSTIKSTHLKFQPLQTFGENSTDLAKSQIKYIDVQFRWQGKARNDIFASVIAELFRRHQLQLSILYHYPLIYLKPVALPSCIHQLPFKH